MSAPAKTQALEALVEAHARELHLPAIRGRFRALTAEAIREQQTPLAYLAALLEAEVQERAERRERRRLLDARFPILKRLEDFHFADNPKVPQATIAALAEGSWIDDRESVILIGESRHREDDARHSARRVRLPTRTPRTVHHPRRARDRGARSRQSPRTRTGRRPLHPHRGSHPRRTGLLGTARRRRRTRLPSHLRAQRTSKPDLHQQPPVRRMDQGVRRPEAREGRRRPDHAQGTHHLSPAPNPGASATDSSASNTNEHDPPPDDAPVAIATKPFALHAQAFATTTAALLSARRSGNINTNNNRRELGPLQAVALGPVQVVVPSRLSRPLIGSPLRRT